MNDSFIILVVFWGVWVLIPVLVDGIYAVIQVTVILIKRVRQAVKHPAIPFDRLPVVSIIIPVNNEEQNIDECLNFLKAQTHPHSKTEIIVVDNGSTDRTREIVKQHLFENANTAFYDRYLQRRIVYQDQAYDIRNGQRATSLVRYHRKNKAHALNLGLEHATGDIMVNIDCRARLAPDAIAAMVEKFYYEPDLGACTGNIEITWQPTTQKDRAGRTAFDANGLAKDEESTLGKDFLSKCQFLEYLTAFRIGREFLAATNSIYTLSGAFSAFRTKLVNKTGFQEKDDFYPHDANGYLRDKTRAWYSDRTITEDTDLTLALQNSYVRIGYAAAAKAFLCPVTSWQRLYAQRVRWHRGEIEVYGLHRNLLGNRDHRWFGRVFFPLTLLIDHTLALPRLIWTALFPFLVFLGYSPQIVFTAFLLIVGIYIVIDFLEIFACYLVVDRRTKQKILSSLHYGFLLSLFRFIVFYFRMSGFLLALKEAPAWTIPGGPVADVKTLSQRTKKFGRRIAAGFIALDKNTPPAESAGWRRRLWDNAYGTPAPAKNISPLSPAAGPRLDLSHRNGLDGINR